MKVATTIDTEPTYIGRSQRYAFLNADAIMPILVGANKSASYAQLGRRTLVVSTDAAHSLADSLDLESNLFTPLLPRCPVFRSVPAQLRTLRIRRRGR